VKKDPTPRRRANRAEWKIVAYGFGILAVLAALIFALRFFASL